MRVFWLKCGLLLLNFLTLIYVLSARTSSLTSGNWLRLCGIRIRNFYCDTSLLAHSLHPEFPKSLAFTTSVYTREPFYKDEGKEFNPKRDKIERYLHYNARDAAVTFEVFDEMMKDACEMKVPGFPKWKDEFVLGHQMALHNFYYDLEDVGFRVNHQRQFELEKLYQDKIQVSQDEA